MADNLSGKLIVVEPARNLASPARTERQVSSTRLTSVAVGDTDGDGLVDVGVASRDHVLLLLRGRGDGSLAEERSFPTGLQPLMVKAEDLDGDGLTDWLLPNVSDSLTVYWGSRTGDLVERGDVFVEGVQFDVGAGDFNGDGRKDLVVTRDGRVKLLTSLGDRAFTPPQQIRRGLDDSDTGGLSEFLQVNVGDLDADGRPDLVVGVLNGSNHHVSVFLGRDGGPLFEGNDAGQFVRVDWTHRLGNSNGSSYLPPTDLDGDGALHVAFAAASGGVAPGVVTLLAGTGNGDGGFHSTQRLALGLQLNPSAIDLVAADFDRDGDLDLAAGGSGELIFLVNETISRRTFQRGDTDANEVLDMSDAVGLLNFIFAGRLAPPCRKAADADDDGELGISDAVKVLTFLFLGGEPLAQPLRGVRSGPDGGRADMPEFRWVRRGLRVGEPDATTPAGEGEFVFRSACRSAPKDHPYEKGSVSGLGSRESRRFGARRRSLLFPTWDV